MYKPCIAMYYYVLPCIAMYYHVLPCIAIHVLQCIAMFYYVLPCIAMHSHVLPCIEMYIENTSWKVLAYGIYARVVDVSEILLVRCAHSFDF